MQTQFTAGYFSAGVPAREIVLRHCPGTFRVYVKSKFISIARLKTTELHQSAVQQIQYNKNSL